MKNHVYLVRILRHKKVEKTAKRVQVTFTSEQWALIEKFRGILGNDDAEIVRNIILSWLSEKSVVVTAVKKNFRGEQKL